MEDLCIWRVSIKSTPKVLAEQQNQFHMEITHDMLVCENHDPDFMKTIITGEKDMGLCLQPRNQVQVLLIETVKKA